MSRKKVFLSLEELFDTSTLPSLQCPFSRSLLSPVEGPLTHQAVFTYKNHGTLHADDPSITFDENPVSREYSSPFCHQEISLTRTHLGLSSVSKKLKESFFSCPELSAAVTTTLLAPIRLQCHGNPSRQSSGMISTANKSSATSKDAFVAFTNRMVSPVMMLMRSRTSTGGGSPFGFTAMKSTTEVTLQSSIDFHWVLGSADRLGITDFHLRAR